MCFVACGEISDAVCLTAMERAYILRPVVSKFTPDESKPTTDTEMTSSH